METSYKANMLVFILLTVLGSVYSCPDLKADSKFNISNFCSGRWFEIARYNIYDLEKDADCIIYHDFSKTKDFYTLVVREVKDKKITNLDIKMFTTNETGKVILHAKGSAMPTVPATVIATDNENYAIFFDCVDGNATTPSAEYAWIVSRTPSIKPELESVLHQYIDEHNILDKKKFKWDQFNVEDCLVDDASVN